MYFQIRNLHFRGIFFQYSNEVVDQVTDRSFLFHYGEEKYYNISLIIYNTSYTSRAATQDFLPSSFVIRVQGKRDCLLKLMKLFHYAKFSAHFGIAI